MKYLLSQSSDYICHINNEEHSFECYLIGFLEQEPDLFKFKNGVIVKSYIDDLEKFYTWESLSIDLLALQRVINCLYNSYYNQKDRLYKDQIYSIIQKLYNQCIVNSVKDEGYSEKQANVIISKSYEEGHSAGYSEVISCCFDNMSFLDEFLNAGN